MEFESWEPQYLQILNDFEFDRSEDEKSAELLAKLLAEQENDITPVTPFDLGNILHDKLVYVFGQGPSLESDVEIFEKRGPIISADGATSTLMKHKIIPDIIVSDLDGRIEDQIEAVTKGSIILIHAHGDNSEQLKKWVPKFKGKVIGTTQAKPFDNIFNFGGFTDGDRAVFLADHFKAYLINLIAFDFEEVGDHKSDPARKIKIRKLTWANVLIGMLQNPDIQFIPSSLK